ncbi:hypothetical protein LXL04_022694 [Taraxacum kok-saghyz]
MLGNIVIHDAIFDVHLPRLESNNITVNSCTPCNKITCRISDKKEQLRGCLICTDRVRHQTTDRVRHQTTDRVRHQNTDQTPRTDIRPRTESEITGKNSVCDFFGRTESEAKRRTESGVRVRRPLSNAQTTDRIFGTLDAHVKKKSKVKVKTAKTSAVCGPYLQASAAEEVDQTSAVCKKKTLGGAEQAKSKLGGAEQAKSKLGGADFVAGISDHRTGAAVVSEVGRDCCGFRRSRSRLLWVPTEEIKHRRAQARTGDDRRWRKGETRSRWRKGESRSRWRKGEGSAALFFFQTQTLISD